MRIKNVLNLFIMALTVLNFTVACASQETTDKAQTDSQTAQPLPAQDIATYIRKAFNIPSDVNINVKEEGESKLPGMKHIMVEFSGPRGTQNQEAWVSLDYKTLLVGKVMDMTIDPYQERLKKMNLAGAPVTGAESAKVTIVGYTDFQCPFCSSAHGTIEQLLKEYDGKIKVVYKSLPLNMHNWAEDSAVAAACVAQQNNETFWKLVDFFFKNQKTITKETVKEKVLSIAREAKLDEAKLTACIDGKQTLAQVQADMREAQSLGFNSTPSFVINGTPLVGALPIEEFRKVIDDALKTAR